MNNNELISVIVPIYNTEKYVRKCIDSIINQTYIDIEILLIDDGSTDNCSQICDEYSGRDLRIQVWHISNGGVAKARNFGLEHCNGQYIMFVDSDDYIEPQMCERLLYKINEYNVGIVASNAYDTDENGICINNDCLENDRLVIFDQNYNFIEKHMVNVSWGSLYKRNAIGNIRFKEDLFVGEDTLFWYEVLSMCGKYMLVRDRFYHYVIYENSAKHGTVDNRKYTEVESWSRVCNLVTDDIDTLKYKSARVALAQRARMLLFNGYNSDKLSPDNKFKLLYIMKSNRKLFCETYSTLKGKIMYIAVYIMAYIYLNLFMRIRGDSGNGVKRHIRFLK